MIEDPSDPGRGRNGRHHGTGRDPLRPQAADGTLDLRIGQIAVLVDSTSAGNARLRLTANLAKALPAEVIGIGVLAHGNAIPAPALPRAAELGVIGLPTFPVVGATSGRVRPEVAAAETETLQAASGAEQHYRDHMAVHSGIQHEWRVIGHGGLGEMVAYAKKADLTVLGQQDPESSGAGDPGFRPEDVVLASGTPTLITPYQAFAEASDSAGMKVSEIILNRIPDLDADLLVAGLFHHSRARETFFGGVSSELLAHLTVPALVSH